MKKISKKKLKNQEDSTNLELNKNIDILEISQFTIIDHIEVIGLLG